ncbi:hypothetical protein E2C01_001654 [Portunus trituberculatus]|uniref:Uncharacterized protein n=1 Tax=Portunus trituberculatus TaxID=210409 RepID=A0A5B7CN18_PORTR|nr:hypothetical protein [Portunus trituberculatus]
MLTYLQSSLTQSYLRLPFTLKSIVHPFLDPHLPHASHSSLHHYRGLPSNKTPFAAFPPNHPPAEPSLPSSLPPSHSDRRPSTVWQKIQNVNSGKG